MSALIIYSVLLHRDQVFHSLQSLKTHKSLNQSQHMALHQLVRCLFVERMSNKQRNSKLRRERGIFKKHHICWRETLRYLTHERAQMVLLVSIFGAKHPSYHYMCLLKNYDLCSLNFCCKTCVNTKHALRCGHESRFHQIQRVYSCLGAHSCKCTSYTSLTT